MNYKHKTILLISVAAIIKLALGSIVELNNDEAYYWTYARQLQWNYFDHPPMVGLLIRIFTGNLSFHQEFFMRFPAVLAGAGCTWIIYKTGALLQDQYTGWIAACLFTASFYASVIAGLLILPDTPQLFFWLLSVYILAALIIKDKKGAALRWSLILAGITIGFCTLSKIHGIFLWIGFLGYAATTKPSLLKNPYLYLSGFITLLMLVPSMLWTAGNQFSTYNYHSSRVNFNHLHPDSFFRELFGEFLYSNPINYILLIGAILFYKHPQQPAVRLLKWLSFPLIGTVIIISLFNDTLPHWNGPAFVALIPYTALYLRNGRYAGIPKIVRYSLGLMVLALLICVGMINYWPGSLGSSEMPEHGKNDVTLDMGGWKQFSDSLKQHQTDEKCLFTDYWFPGGHLDYYTSHKLKLPVKVVGGLNDIHHFAWINAHLPVLQKGENAWFITISNFYRQPPAQLTTHFTRIEAPVRIPQLRNGVIVRYFYVYRLINYTGGLPADGLLK